MTREIVSFKKEYSALGSLQQAYTVRYSLCKNGDELTVKVEKCQQENLHSDSASVAQGDLQGAMLAVRYLYENAVPIENWRDVLEDIRERERQTQ